MCGEWSPGNRGPRIFIDQISKSWMPLWRVFHSVSQCRFFLQGLGARAKSVLVRFSIAFTQIDCLQPSVFPYIYSVVERADRIAREMWASENWRPDPTPQPLRVCARWHFLLRGLNREAVIGLIGFRNSVLKIILFLTRPMLSSLHCGRSSWQFDRTLTSIND